MPSQLLVALPLQKPFRINFTLLAWQFVVPHVPVADIQRVERASVSMYACPWGFATAHCFASCNRLVQFFFPAVLLNCALRTCEPSTAATNGCQSTSVEPGRSEFQPTLSAAQIELRLLYAAPQVQARAACDLLAMCEVVVSARQWEFQTAFGLLANRTLYSFTSCA